LIEELFLNEHPVLIEKWF